MSEVAQKQDKLFPETPSAPPMSRAEMEARGWDALDVLLVTGDAFVDHPAFGAAVIARVLEADGWRVGVIAQPDWRNPESVKALGRPRLFCGVTAGNLDSMLANYTAARRKRDRDAYSENGEPGKRPNHATVVYTQLLRRAFKGVPVILGGIEASLRRVAHYDYWQDRVRPSILQDSKADLLVYGMGEEAIREIARRLHANFPEPFAGIRGTARLLGGRESGELDLADGILLPSADDCRREARNILGLTQKVEREQNPFCGRRLIQFHGARALLVEPPAPPLSESDLDRIYELPYTHRPHPSYTGSIPAFRTTENSVTVVRGCAGGCSFCGLGFHQGRFISSRSSASIIREIDDLVQRPGFHGTVTDVGGPTANLYGCGNGNSDTCRKCRRASCLFPTICRHFAVDGAPHRDLLRRVGRFGGIRHVYVSSGIRMDVALRTPDYLRDLIRHHVAGHLKVAPEHLDDATLRRMRKPDSGVFQEFRRVFEQESRKAGKKQYLVPYFISSFPGCTREHMGTVEAYLRRERWDPQQVQDFIPLPMTPAAAMYCSGLDYETGEPIPVASGLKERRHQKRQLQPGKQRQNRQKGKRSRRKESPDSRRRSR